MRRPGTLGAVLDAGDADAIRVSEPARVVEFVLSASSLPEERQHISIHATLAAAATSAAPADLSAALFDKPKEVSKDEQVTMA